MSRIHDMIALRCYLYGWALALFVDGSKVDNTKVIVVFGRCTIIKLIKSLKGLAPELAVNLCFCSRDMG